MERHNFSLRTPHLQRRTPIDQEYATHFLDRLRTARQEYPAERIFNFDETSWKRYVGPNKVLAEKGSEAVELKTVIGEKDSSPGYGCISAAGEKLPFWILTKGKTDLSHAKFNAPQGVIIRHTPSGWTNEEMMVQFLEWLSGRVSEQPCLLVLDVYPAHRTLRLQELIRELRIELLFVPAGGTSQFQPLDRCVFGELKSRARTAFERIAWQRGTRGTTPEQSVAVLVQA
jgi:hypothetical protein